MYRLSLLLAFETPVPICKESVETKVAWAFDVVAVGYDEKLRVKELTRIVVFDVSRRPLRGFRVRRRGY
jgi:hypothetical protein